MPNRLLFGFLATLLAVGNANPIYSQTETAESFAIKPGQPFILSQSKVNAPERAAGWLQMGRLSCCQDRCWGLRIKGRDRRSR